jgi:Flp pilus assembly protein TadD
VAATARGNVRSVGLAIALIAALGALPSAQPPDAVGAVTAALRERQFAEAAERSQQALRHAPNDPRLWTLNGLALASLEDPGDRRAPVTH